MKKINPESTTFSSTLMSTDKESQNIESENNSTKLTLHKRVRIHTWKENSIFYPSDALFLNPLVNVNKTTMIRTVKLMSELVSVDHNSLG